MESGVDDQKPPVPNHKQRENSGRARIKDALCLIPFIESDNIQKHPGLRINKETKGGGKA